MSYFRTTTAIALVLAFCAATPAARASLSFGDPVDLDLSLFGFSVIEDVTALDFGTGTDPLSTARFALNTTDNGDTMFGPLDTTKLVGHSLITTANTAGSFLPTVLPSGLQLTGVLEIDGVILPDPVNGGVKNSFTSGTLKLFVDTSPIATSFDPRDVKTSGDGTLVAFFDLDFGEAVIDPGLGLASNTLADFKLNEDEAEVDDFFKLNGETLAENLATLFLQTDSRERFLSLDDFPDDDVITDDLDILVGIGEGTDDPVDIGEGFSPTTPINPFDVFLVSDGDVQFAVVPEATSLLVWGGMSAVCGLVATRRRRNAS